MKFGSLVSQDSFPAPVISDFEQKVILTEVIRAYEYGRDKYFGDEDDYPEKAPFDIAAVVPEEATYGSLPKKILQDEISAKLEQYTQASFKVKDYYYLQEEVMAPEPVIREFVVTSPGAFPLWVEQPKYPNQTADDPSIKPFESEAEADEYWEKIKKDSSLWKGTVKACDFLWGYVPADEPTEPPNPGSAWKGYNLTPAPAGWHSVEKKTCTQPVKIGEINKPTGELTKILKTRQVVGAYNNYLYWDNASYKIGSYEAPNPKWKSAPGFIIQAMSVWNQIKINFYNVDDCEDGTVEQIIESYDYCAARFAAQTAAAYFELVASKIHNIFENSELSTAVVSGHISSDPAVKFAKWDKENFTSAELADMLLPIISRYFDTKGNQYYIYGQL